VGLDVVYASEGAEHVVRLTAAEWACVERLRAVAPAAVDALFCAPAFGEPVPLAADDLAAAADAVQAALRDWPDLLPAAYQMRLERLPGSDVRDGTWQGGAISGLRLPGEPDFFMLRVGPDCCQLTRVRVGEGGRGVLAGAEDIRGRASIDTETVGRIDLRRRPAGAALRKRLAELRAFFAGVSGGRVSKMLC
jgi:hypothetical protein